METNKTIKLRPAAGPGLALRRKAPQQCDPTGGNGCQACRLKCPTEAVLGAKKEVHSIIQEKCIKCGTCLDACKFDTIVVE